MFTDDEAKVYDRQIRLWGVSAQMLIRGADILVIGLTGLASEMVKNLVLTGINSVTIVDDQVVTEFDMMDNLFTRHQVGKNRATAVLKGIRELNPMVAVNARESSLEEFLKDEHISSTIEKFRVVISFNQSLESTVQLNKICNHCKVPFFAACDWGSFSMLFYDLGKTDEGHFVSFEKAIEKKNIHFKHMDASRKLSRSEKLKLAKIRSIFVAILTLYRYNKVHGVFPTVSIAKNCDDFADELKELEFDVLKDLGDDWKCNLEHWHTKVVGKFSFVASIAGGLLAQDVIRAVTNELIDFNLFLFDGLVGYNVTIGLE